MAQRHPIWPLLTIPNEVLYEIAQYLPCRCQISLQGTCQAFLLPLRSLLVSAHKKDISLFAAGHNYLDLLTCPLSAGADTNYCGRSFRGSMHHGATALRRAAAGGHTGIITELLRHKHSLEDRGRQTKPRSSPPPPTGTRTTSSASGATLMGMLDDENLSE